MALMSFTCGEVVAGSFPPAFDKEPKRATLQVCPGDEELFVGGGALNGSIGKALREARHPVAFVEEEGSLVFNKEKCPFAPLHMKAFTEARRTPNRLYHAYKQVEEANSLPLLYSGARVFSSSTHPFGIAIIDIFREDSRPSHEQNVGLLYTVGPLGQNKKAEGEGEVTQEREALVVTDPQAYCLFMYNMAANITAAVGQYNQTARGSLPRIEAIRLPLVGGGTFKHPAISTREVAMCIIWGLHAGLAPVPLKQRFRVDLMPSADMKAALGDYTQGKTPANISDPEGHFSKLPTSPGSEYSTCGGCVAM